MDKVTKELLDKEDAEHDLLVQPREIDKDMRRLARIGLEHEMKVKLIEVEVNKISLQPGDVLMTKVKGPDFKDDEVVQMLGESLRKVFPNNKVGVLYLDGNDIDFTVVSANEAEKLKQENSENNACSPANYCVDCNCGKKALAEGSAND
jgi:hypothetical protein